jgi:hypothetical protein
MCNIFIKFYRIFDLTLRNFPKISLFHAYCSEIQSLFDQIIQRIFLVNDEIQSNVTIFRLITQ